MNEGKIELRYSATGSSFAHKLKLVEFAFTLIVVMQALFQFIAGASRDLAPSCV